ncbi:unnamed protein product [Moneuplotes crassus]|uniref:Uncharacterized protein n=1 Tax=Euplotes crassus TaxID=5936 RepID=A0AAD1X6P8_EUPCR|nr:unnamed protein product [Moneuplotes crassus]
MQARGTNNLEEPEDATPGARSAKEIVEQQLLEKYDKKAQTMRKKVKKSADKRFQDNLISDTQSPKKRKPTENTYASIMSNRRAMKKESPAKPRSTSVVKEERKNSNTKLTQFLSPGPQNTFKVDLDSSSDSSVPQSNKKKEIQRYQIDDTLQNQETPSDHEKWEQKLRLTVEKYENMLCSVNQGFRDLILTNENLELQLQHARQLLKTPNESNQSVEAIKQAFMKQQMEYDRAQERFQIESERHQEEKEELLQKLHASSLRVSQLEREISYQENLNHSLDAMKNYNSQENIYKTENTTLRIKVDELISKINEIDRNSKLKDESLTTLASELETCKDLLNDYEISDSQYKRDVINLAQDKEDLQNQFQEYQRTIKTLEASNTQTKDRLLALQRENELLQTSITQTKQDERRLLEELSRYKSQLNSVQERCKSFEMDTFRQEKTLKCLSDENLRLKRLLQDSGDDSEESKMILHKEMELQQLKQRQMVRRASKGRSIERIPCDLYSAMSYPHSSPEEKIYATRDTRSSAHESSSSKYIPPAQPGLGATPFTEPAAEIGKFQNTSHHTLSDDPFWKNRDTVQQETNVKRITVMNNFIQNSPKRGKNKQEKLDPSKMEPAGKLSLNKRLSAQFTG